MNKKVLIGIIVSAVALAMIMGIVIGKNIGTTNQPSTTNTSSNTTTTTTTKPPHTHIQVVDPSVAATCSSTGLSAGMHCSECGKILVVQQTISKISCIASDWIVDKEATKTEDGKRHKECTMCGTKMSEETIFATGSLGLAYTVNSNGTSCTITGTGTCTDSHVVIPAVIDGYNVTEIANRAFYNCTTIKEITIPASITNIGTQVFYKASNLHTVYYNSSYTSKTNSIMRVSSIKKVVFGGNMIPEDILYDCSNVETIEINPTVTSIGTSAFNGCTSLTSITIPNSVTSIGDWAFYNCQSLVNVYYLGDVEDWLSIVFPLYGVASTPVYYGGNLYFNGELVTEIIIPDSITSIGYKAFSHCTSLTSVKIPDSVTSIGAAAFSNCTGLASIEIPDSITSIGDSVFSNCSALTSVVIPNSVTSIDIGAFSDCTSLTQIVIPYSVTRILGRPFDGCNKLTIYCEATSKPSGWSSTWNYSYQLVIGNILYDKTMCPVVWGYTSE